MSEIKRQQSRKKSFFNEQSRKKVSEKRLYIVLACCVVSIGAIYFATSALKVENEATESKRSDIKYSLPAPLETTPPSDQEIIEAPTGEEADNSLDNDDDFFGASRADFKLAKSNEEQSTESVEAEFLYPADGEIILGYNNKPTYSEAFDDWRTHEGIDIAANIGGDVFASKSGKISKIFNDSIYGLTIAIEHDENTKTLYSNLADTNNLREGDTVSRGDLIAHVGESAAGEQNLPPHIHFEILIDNKPKNPSDFIN